MCTFQPKNYHSLTDYQPPTWAGELKSIPEKRIQLAQLPTPLHKWTLNNVPAHVELFIKRDDLTGSTLSGNKVRKLEFILASAVSRGCKSVITCGSMQSNHCRATAVAA
uniref:Tryptophan synthase beta chain-like PALP domain-containing protein n=1 Tax=Ciona savignyi TaxID=51511 RepID=H2ZNP5_CIOSA